MIFYYCTVYRSGGVRQPNHNTRLSIEITDCQASSSSLDLFSLGYPHLGVRVPQSQGVFQLWPNQGIACRFTDLWHLCLNVPPDKAKRPVCSPYYSLSVGIPGQITGDINPEIFGTCDGPL